MKFPLLFVSLFCFLMVGCGNSSIASAQPSGSTINPASFNSRVAALKEEHGARVVIAGVWQGGQEISKLALGESMTGVPASTDMTVRIGGISQLFLGTLVMRLVEQGQFSLDDKISTWLPGFYQAENVTVGMLIRNLGGYKDFVLNDQFVDDVLADPFRDFTWDQLLEYSVSERESNFPPGTSQRYSHTEFVILAQVIEAATGRTMPELYQTEILDPLDLSRTGYSQNADLPAPVLHAFSSDRDIYEDSTFWNVTWAGESGPLYSTIDDLGTWGPAFGQGRLLTPESFQELTKRAEVAPSPNVYFAMGFVVAGGWYFQNPNLNGYSGVLAYLPERDITLIVFATQPEVPISGHPARDIFLELVTEVAPDYPIDL
jgi:D-alanyl-D-alanine carboxypeptidase